MMQRLYKSGDKRKPWVFLSPSTGKKRRYSGDMLRKIKGYCMAAGVSPFGYHAIRHLSAKTAKEACIETRDVGKFLGHLRESTTERYLESLEPGLNAVSDALEDGNENKMVDQVVDGDTEKE
ncbi:MAG: tyrosine-type recombinase/integrase [Desulfatibacillum sp.]|nr:tyrosine-type recombinase/integrase [Desulfatibacillum sp.]